MTNMTKEKNETKNIHQRINAVMQSIGYIKKDTQVMKKKDAKVMKMYSAISHDKVISSVRAHLIENGIIIQSSQVSIAEPFKCIPTSRDPLQLFRAVYLISFINMDDPEDRLCIKIEAHAQCLDDKSPGKTYSYAVKMAILKVFCLETGENDESQHAPQEPKIEYITRDQAIDIRAKAKALNLGEKVLASLEVPSYDKIPSSKYAWTMTHLNKHLIQ